MPTQDTTNQHSTKYGNTEDETVQVDSNKDSIVSESINCPRNNEKRVTDDDLQSLEDKFQRTELRENIEGANSSLGAIFPTKQEGIRFLIENNSWGFVSLQKRPEFVAFYISAPRSKVQYFARVSRIVNAGDADLARPPQEYPEFSPSSKVIVFEQGSLCRLEDPIPYQEQVPYSLRYTTMEKFRSASVTDQLF